MPRVRVGIPRSGRNNPRRILVRDRTGRIYYEALANELKRRASEEATAIAVAYRSGTMDNEVIEEIANTVLIKILRPEILDGFTFDPSLLGEATVKLGLAN